MTSRYYFHGDQKENELGQYYCAYCDLFFNDGHFREESHSGKHLEKFKDSKVIWSTIKKASNVSLHRPKNSTNIVQSKFGGKGQGSAFYKWIKRQAEREDPIGDLASDMIRDHRFPVFTSSLEKVKIHLINNLACEETIQALEEAHEEFREGTTSRGRITLSLRFNIFRRDGYACQICGARASDGVRLEVDHKIPVSKGGADDEDNLWTLCFSCNRGKSDMNL